MWTTDELLVKLRKHEFTAFAMDRAADEIERLRAERDHLAKGLISIALNTCCEGCQEAKKVAKATLDWHTVNEQNAVKEK